jgi:hypothetical protein
VIPQTQALNIMACKHGDVRVLVAKGKTSRVGSNCSSDAPDMQPSQHLAMPPVPLHFHPQA